MKRIDMWGIDMLFVVGGNGGNAGANAIHGNGFGGGKRACSNSVAPAPSSSPKPGSSLGRGGVTIYGKG